MDRGLREQPFVCTISVGSFVCVRKTKVIRAVSKAKHHVFRNFNKWQTAILSSFGYDPLNCPDCNHEMLFLELYYNHKRVSLEEMYEKAMSRSRRKQSSA